QVTLALAQDDAHYRLDHLRDIRRTLEVGPGATVRFALFQPDHPPATGSALAVTIDGDTREQRVPLPVVHSQNTRGYGPGYAIYSSGPSVQPLVLLSPSVGADFPTRILRPPAWALGGAAGPGMMPGMGGPPGPPVMEAADVEV